MTSDAMFSAFLQCMAIISWSSQDGVDFLIPVLLRSGDVFQESVMTGILIQVKLRKIKGSALDYEIDQKNVFFPVSSGDESLHHTGGQSGGVTPDLQSCSTLRAPHAAATASGSTLKKHTLATIYLLMAVQMLYTTLPATPAGIYTTRAKSRCS